MFPHGFLLQATWMHGGRRIWSRRRPIKRAPNKTKLFRPLTRCTSVEEAATNEKKDGIFPRLIGQMHLIFFFFRNNGRARRGPMKKKATLFPRLIGQVVSEAAFDALNAPHCCIKCRKPRALNATRFLPIHVATRGLPKMAAIVRKMDSISREGEYRVPCDLISKDGERSSKKWITFRSTSDGGRSSKLVSTWSRNRGHPRTWSVIERCRPIVEELHDRGPIEPRSRRDRTAIGGLTWSNRCQPIRGRSTDGQDHDRGPIAARSWPDRGQIDGYSQLKRSGIYGQHGSFEFAPRKRSHDHAKPLPRPPLQPTISGLIFSLKPCISLLCSSTFDRLVKKLSEFRGRS